MVVIFTIAAFLFINEKKTEMADDIYINSLAFAKLTAANVAHNYDLYLDQNSFVYFNREISSIFEKNDDVSAIKVISYDGVILYNSDEDKDKRYEGAERLTVDSVLVDAVQAENVSVKVLEGDSVFLKQDVEGDISYVDKNENVIESLESGILFEYLVVPANEKYSVVYTLDYSNLEARVAAMMKRIIYLAIFAIMLGMFLSFGLSSQLTRPISKLVKGASKIAKGDFKARVEINTRDEMKFLGNAFNQMARDLEVSMDAKLYKERVTHELELAKDIQKQILPDMVPEVDGLDIAAGIIPAAEIGGDVYDFIPQKEKLLMYLGDVTGHGVSAGIVSSIANALFYGYAGNEDLEKIMDGVNRVMKAKTMSNMFMTLCLTQWDSIKKKFTYVSAGHEQIIHYKSSENSVELAPAGGVALGMVKDITQNISVDEIDMQEGDFVVIYSDGIPEAWKNDDEKYGMDRFKSAVQKFGDLDSALAIKKAILADVKQFSGDHEQMDDITLIVAKRIS